MDLEVRRAYALLELSPPVTEPDLRRRYRELAKRWHPDRYAADPTGQAEAAQRMRDINDAYRLLVAQTGARPDPDAVAAAPAPAASGLSRKDIAGIVASINRSTAWSLWPKMSLDRWLSVAVVIGYFVVATDFFLPPARTVGAEIHRAVGKSLGYFWLPLFFIWRAEAESTPPEGRALFRAIGWLLMLAPAALGAIWLMWH